MNNGAYKVPTSVAALWLISATINVLSFVYLHLSGSWVRATSGSIRVFDFMQLWAAALRVVRGEALLAYDWEQHALFQQRLFDLPQALDLGFFHAPHSLLLLAPLGLLGYVPAFYGFVSVTIILLTLALQPIIRRWWAAGAAALSLGGGTMAIFIGQTGFLTAALLTGGLAVMPNRPRLAGTLFGLATIKPQLGIAVALALIILRRWTVILCAIGTTVALSVVTSLLFGWTVWPAFFSAVSDVSGFTVNGATAVKLQSTLGVMLPSLREFDPLYAYLAAATMMVVVLGLLSIILRSESPYGTKAGAILISTLLAAPYLYAYDAVILTGAAAFLARDARNQAEPIAAVLLAMLPGIYIWHVMVIVPIAAWLMICLVLLRVVREDHRRHDAKGAAQRGM